jgi:hypothetical protein
MAVIATLAVLASVQAHAQTRNGEPAPGCTIGNLKEEPANTVTAISSFLSELQAAVKENRRKEVAKLVSYPLNVSTPDGKNPVRSEQEFLAHYDKIFPAGLKLLLLRQTPECVSRVGVRGFTFGHGQIWFDEYPDGKVRIFTITPVAYPGE